MDRAASLHLDRPGLVYGFADHVHDAPERALADRHRDRLAGVRDLLAAHQALGNVHGDAAHRVLAELLGDFEHELVAIVVGRQRIENGRQVAVELDVDDGADHLGDAAGGVRDIGHGSWSSYSSISCRAREGAKSGHSASAPEMISISSLVIIAWRVRL